MSLYCVVIYATFFFKNMAFQPTIVFNSLLTVASMSLIFGSSLSA